MFCCRNTNSMDGIKKMSTVSVVILLFLLHNTQAADPYADLYYDAGFGDGYDGYMNDWAPDREWSSMRGRINQPRCVDIPSNMSLCQNIGYESMRLPNLLEHDTIDEVMHQSSQWNVLANRGCNPNTKLFLCSLFSPVCLDRPIYPCRSLCESVKAGCENHMLRYGYPWPEMLSCDKFPLDDGLCIGMISQQQEVTCPACSQTNSFEAIIDNYCNSDSVYRTKLKREGSEADEKVVYSGKKIKKMKGNNLTSQQRNKGLSIYLEDSTRCDCGLGHKQSPDYFAMGNYVNGKFYANAFHLYERDNHDLKRAIRRIRRDRQLCQRDVSDLIRESEEPEPPQSQARRARGNQPPIIPEVQDRRVQGQGEKVSPNAAEIAERKAARAERRRQERLARNDRKSEDGDAEGGEEQVRSGGEVRRRMSKEERRAARRQAGADAFIKTGRRTPEERRLRQQQQQAAADALQ